MATTKSFPYASQMKKNGGYFHDIITNTLYITKEFQRKANQYGTTECRIMDELMLGTANKPTVQIHTHKRAPRLTYAMMEVFISKMPDAERNFEAYRRTRLKNNIATNPYKEVLTWFEETYPFYGQYKVVENDKLVWNALDEYRKAMEQQAARNDKKIVSMPHKEEADNHETVAAS